MAIGGNNITSKYPHLIYKIGDNFTIGYIAFTMRSKISLNSFYSVVSPKKNIANFF